MVAYGFNSRFEPLIAAGTKLQTIRAIGNRRHAEPGDRMQIYVGMRTKKCRKVIADPVCIVSEPITLEIPDSPTKAGFYQIGDPALNMPKFIDAGFAAADGFASVEEFIEFFIKAHGPGVFKGRLIKWAPR